MVREHVAVKNNVQIALLTSCAALRLATKAIRRRSAIAPREPSKDKLLRYKYPNNSPFKLS